MILHELEQEEIIDIQAMKYINDADKQYLSLLNKRIRKGESHLIPKANEQLALTGQSTLSFSKVVK